MITAWRAWEGLPWLMSWRANVSNPLTLLLSSGTWSGGGGAVTSDISVSVVRCSMASTTPPLSPRFCFSKSVLISYIWYYRTLLCRCVRLWWQIKLSQGGFFIFCLVNDLLDDSSKFFTATRLFLFWFSNLIFSWICSARIELGLVLQFKRF